MAALSVNNNSVALSCGYKSCIVNELGEVKLFQTSKTSEPVNSEVEDSKNDDVKLTLVCSDISPCGKWLAVCYTSKYLNFWDIASCKLISNRKLLRRASQIKFTPSSKFIIVADKTGDVYRFSTTDFQAPGDLILGHLSIVLDFLITLNEEYIITCDRDEKIRVSYFPNGYNIKSFCLGHEEFVSSICFLPHNDQVIISGSGDGTLRLWHYCLGNQIGSVKCYEKIDGAPVTAVTNLTATLKDQSSTLICASLYEFKGIFVYLVNRELCFSFITIIDLVQTPHSIKLTEGKILWILSATEKLNIVAKCWNEVNQTFINAIDKVHECMLKNINSQDFNLAITSNFINLLYKRKFNNVQTYLEKKQERINDNTLYKKFKNA